MTKRSQSLKKTIYYMIPYDSNYMTFCERQNYRDSKKDQQLSVVREERGMNRQKTEDF